MSPLAQERNESDERGGTQQAPDLIDAQPEELGPPHGLVLLLRRQLGARRGDRA